MLRWAGRLFGGLVLLVMLLAGGAAAALWWTLPPRSGEPALPGLSAPVELAFGSRGVPRIRARTEADAWAALGWVHARDRMFQMEMMRRSAAGRLSEIAGPATLRVDRFMRLMGLRQRAEADLAALPADSRAALDAYARGVNAWIAARGRFAAPEFLLLGAPEPWRPVDSLLWGKAMGLYLSGNWRAELERARLAAILPPERLADLWPEDDTPGRPDAPRRDAAPPGPDPRTGMRGPRSGPPPDRAIHASGGMREQDPLARTRGRCPAPDPTPRAAGDTASGKRIPEQRPLATLRGPCPGLPPDRAIHAFGDRALAGLLAALPVFPGDAPLPRLASNAWAVGGDHTASGKPLLATDPHLGFQAPILWYLARIELPGGRILAGATAPGVPGIIIGRSDRLAWGFTTTTSDTQDIFVERLAGPDAYQTPEGPRPFALREETIRIRGAAPVTLRVRETRHGPVVSDLDAPAGRPDGTVLAVAMANLAPADTAAAGLLALNRAGSIVEARAAAALITSPSQNLTVADAGGGIALYLTGRTPLRRSGDGFLPVPGWDGRADWTGFAPFDAMPHVENPASGRVVNANNRVAPPGRPPFLARDWPGDWRFRRIVERLDAEPRAIPATSAAIQADSVSLLAAAVLPALRAAPRPAGAAGKAQDLLEDWEGEMAADRPQPLVFHATLGRFGGAILARAGVPPEARRPSAEFLQRVLTRPEVGAAWCGEAGCGPLLAEAMARAVADLAPVHGADPAAWRWGRAHPARFEHPILRFLPVLGRLTRIETASGGDGETVGRAGLAPEAGGIFANVHGAGFRGVFDLSDPAASFVVIATGQSGNPLSPHWDDQLPAWRDGMLMRLGPLANSPTARLRLVP